MIILGLAAQTFWGMLLVNLFLHKNSPWLEKAAIGYLLSMGILTMAMFLGNLMGISYSFSNLCWLNIFLGLTSLCLIKIKGLTIKDCLFWKQSPLKLVKKTSWLQWFGFLTIGFLIFSAFFSAIYWPAKDWDSLALYDFRAKTFVETGFMMDGIGRGYFFGYPLLSSLSHTIVYLLGFSYPGIVHWLFYVSLLIVFYFALKKFSSSKLALIGVLGLTLSHDLYRHAYMTYSNLAYVAYLASGYLYLISWVHSKRVWEGMLAAMLIGMSIWTRNAEPFWITGLLLILFFAIKFRHWWLIGGSLLAISFFRYPWLWFEQIYSDKNRSIEANMSSMLTDGLENLDLLTLANTGDYMNENILVHKWRLFSYMGIALLYWLLNYKEVKRHLVVALCLFFGNLLLVFVGIYLLSLRFESWTEIGDSARRMSLFFRPLGLFILILTLDNWFKKVRVLYHKRHA